MCVASCVGVDPSSIYFRAHRVRIWKPSNFWPSLPGVKARSGVPSLYPPAWMGTSQEIVREKPVCNSIGVVQFCRTHNDSLAHPEDRALRECGATSTKKPAFFGRLKL